jgi:hypothetical protein
MKIATMSIGSIGMVFCLSLFGFVAESAVYMGLIR